MIQELENDSSNDSSDPSKKIPSTTWDFFSKLFSVKPEFERQNNYYSNILEKLDSSCYTI